MSGRETYSSCTENALEQQHPFAPPKHERKKKRFALTINVSSSAESHRGHSGQRAGSSQKKVVVVCLVWKTGKFLKHLAVSKINIEENNQPVGNKYPNPLNASRF